MNACPFCGAPCRGDTCQGHADLRQSQLVLDDPDTAFIVAFTVLGEPAPQGSKVRNRYGGIREANPRTRPYRQAVAAEAEIAMDGNPPYSGPVEICVRFYFNRPKAHYGSGSRAEILKDSAPLLKASAPDGSKLRRLVEDALSGIAFRNDAQVVHGEDWKLYGSPARAEIEVRSLVANDRSPPAVPLHAT